MMTEKSGNYYAWMLRIWRNDEKSPWRARLENPHTGRSHGFASLAQLYEFLEQRASASSATAEEEDRTKFGGS